MTPREAFLAGDRPDDVAIFLSADSVDDPDELGSIGRAERVSGGVVLIVPGEKGRDVLSRLTGRDAMAFAQAAGETRSQIDRDLTDGVCPDATDVDPHDPVVIFAFVQEANEEVGGLYAEGPVVHAYAACDCGTSYSERWIAGEDG